MFKKVCLLVLVITVGLLTADPLFEVKDDEGISIFSVTNTGVEIFGMSLASDGTGFQLNDAADQPLFAVSKDSIRFYVYDLLQDESRGSFAVATVTGLSDDIIYDNFLDLNPKNTFIGQEAGASNLTGAYNQFIGFKAGTSNTIGDYNQFMGYQAGLSNISGGNNVYVGYQSGSANTGSGNVFIGNNSGSTLAEQSNKLIIDNSNDTTPLIHGDFATDVVTINDVLTLTPRDGAPQNPTAGMIYFDSNDNILMMFDGSYWVALLTEGY